MKKQITGYHFTGTTLKNGEPIPRPGVWLIHKGEIMPCSSGLHASVKVFDALQYAPGPMLHKVILAGELQSHGNPIDKYVGRKRKILSSIDATQLLWDFARWCALSVADKWDCPPTVRQYLETGDETLRAAARDAAWTAARAAASRSAAMTAAWAAAGAAAMTAARNAARNAASRSAAWDAAWTAARDAAEDAQRKHLQSMVNGAMKGL
jgi:hypothetical protein